MKTKRYKLNIVGANCEFFLLFFDDFESMHKYFKRKIPDFYDDEIRAACLAHYKKRHIVICLYAGECNEYIIGHEAFHAALYYMKMNKKWYRKEAWLKVRELWSTGSKHEEEMADVCGTVISAIKTKLNANFIIKE